MPKRATYHLRWQPQTQQYAVFAGEAPVIPMVIAGDPAWLRWLSEVSSFAFVARSGATCTVRKEAVQRGGDYWYAYRRVQGRMAKRYLGRSAGLTPARLEEVAMALAALTQADGVPMPAAPVAVAEQPATHHQPPEPTPGETIETADTRRMGARQSSEAVPLRASHLLLTTKLQMPRNGATGQPARHLATVGSRTGAAIDVAHGAGWLWQNDGALRLGTPAIHPARLGLARCWR